MFKQITEFARSRNESPNVVALLDHFYHQGPNGRHLCLAFEPMGPSTAYMVEELPCNQQRRPGAVPKYPVWMAKEILGQALQGLDFLHRNGIAHGDFQPGNLLFAVRSLDSIPEKE